MDNTKFNTEAEFEAKVIEALRRKGWGEYEVIKYPTEEQLLQNWANILFENNRQINRLGDYPLTESEMQQIIDQINLLRTPVKLNEFINNTISITRDNPDDTLNFGKEISLKLYDRKEIAAGQSRYQIAQQPKFKRQSKLLNDRRGDLMLLINGMPLIHIELKKSDVSVSQACNQIEKYAREGIFSNGIFSLIQVFVAMEPKETVYFANPGPEGKFNKEFYFHWANFNNEPINDWDDVIENLLVIPMAHQLIGFYTIADKSDDILKVMRSYQIYAARAISDRVAKHDWKSQEQLGGYVWHTTGSGKTVTSFKSAQLIASSKDADKVVFLVDRIELGTQSLLNYRAFATDRESVQATESTGILVKKLKSDSASDILIVTSIQKMSNIKNEEGGLNSDDIQKMSSKRIVFIIDECHRSTFGDMLSTIKETFPKALFFGFTGTPIFDENTKSMCDTTDVFGSELHRYSIADGIRDKNVLGFEPHKVSTYKDKDLRLAVALGKAKASTIEEAMSNETKKAVFNKYMNPSEIKMAGYEDETGNYIKGIEDFVPKSQYRANDKHQMQVIEHIKSDWTPAVHQNKFHALFATSSIPEAIDYYRLIKKEMPNLKITCLFDPNISDKEGEDFEVSEYRGEKVSAYKEKGLVEILNDYNNLYDQKFDLGTHAKFKKDVAARLAHKKPYKNIALEPEKQIDILIVVDQMLTGFDSKWINTLYFDKVYYYQNIIQAFSRTNRIFNAFEKPYGRICYYRYPNSMQRNIEQAFKTYSGDKPFGIFVDKLEKNLKKINDLYEEISELFKRAGYPSFEKNPDDKAEKGKFAKLFNEFNLYLSAAKIQGFIWKQAEYHFKYEDNIESTITVNIDENTYFILVKRYKELFTSGSIGEEAPPYEVNSYITEIDTGLIDNEYMNSRFKKYLKDLEQKNVSELELEKILEELHKSFAVLTQEEQKYANLFLQDVQSGNIQVEENKTFRDYVTEYQINAKNDKITKLSKVLGLNEKALRDLIDKNVNENNINQNGYFDDLKASVDRNKAKAYFEKVENIKLKPYQVSIKIDIILRKIILDKDFDI